MKTKLVANKDVTTRDGRTHKAGEKFELDQAEAQEIIQRGEAKEDTSQQKESSR